MPIRVVSNVLTLVAKGFVEDPWVRDGIHARCFVAPGFGLPRSRFYFAYRAALGDELPADVHSETRALDEAQVSTRQGAFVRFPGLAIRRADAVPLAQLDAGLPPHPQPYLLYFSDEDGRATQAAWVRISFQILGQASVSAVGFDIHGAIVDRSRSLQATTLTLRGMISWVRIGAPQARVVAVEWVSAESYANSGGWKGESVRLPLLPADTPHYQGHANALVAAKARLLAARAKAEGPAQTLAIPPSGGPPSDAALEARVIAPYLAHVRGWLQALFDESQSKPQAQVRVAHAMAIEGKDANLEIPVRQLVDMLVLDPDIARYLGFGAVIPVVSGAVDLLVFADLHASDVADDRVADMKILAGSAATLRVGALAIGVAAKASKRPAAPENPTVVWQNPPPPDSEHAAQVRLAWDPADDAVAYVVRRTTAASSSIRPDGDRELTAPSVDGDRMILDDFLPTFGEVSYAIAARDLWGSWSDWAEVGETFTDPVAPPAPVRVTAKLEGRFGAQQLIVEWDWFDSQALQAPDLTLFRVYARQGLIAASQGWRHPDAWDGVELQAGVVSPTPQVDAATGQAAGLETQVTQATDAETGSGFRRYRASFEVTAAFDIDGVARMTVTVSAVDSSGNESEPVAVPAVARGVDPSPPPPVDLPGFVHASIGDALSEAFHVVRWTRHNNSTYDVFLASERDIQRVHPSPESMPEDRAARVAWLRAQSPAMQRAFRSVFPAAIGPGSETNAALQARLSLPARSRSLYVAAVVGQSTAGTPGPWPTTESGFTVIEIPNAEAPGPPSLERVSPDGLGNVELRIRLDKQRPTARIHLHRTVHPAKAEHVAWMRPLFAIDLGELPKPGETLTIEAGTITHVVASEQDPAAIVVTIHDGTLGPWRRAWYRVTAEGVAIGGLSRGTISPASAVGTVRTRLDDPPEPPADLHIRARGTQRWLMWRAPLPARATDPGPYRVKVMRHDSQGPWQTVAITSSGPELEEGFARREDQWRFSLPAGKAAWRVRISDPLGRVVLSEILEG